VKAAAVVLKGTMVVVGLTIVTSEVSNMYWRRDDGIRCPSYKARLAGRVQGTHLGGPLKPRTAWKRAFRERERFGRGASLDRTISEGLKRGDWRERG
jgi:hypothetical protein